MKKILITATVFLYCLTIYANSNELNIYIWSGYITQAVIRKFEKQTDIKVNVSEYDSNETMYAKLKTAPNSSYDVIIPTNYYVERMHKQKMLHKLDKSKLPNFKYLKPSLLNQRFDLNNNYSVPYLWGVTGIVVNKKYINPKDVQKWDDLWQKKYKNQLLMMDDFREAFSVALITLGYSINDTNPKHIYLAYLKLKKLMPNIRIFNSDAAQNIYIDEDVLIGMGWSGDINVAQIENKNLTFIFPKDGFSIWMDCFSIPKNAPHLDNAYKFINFLMKPEIAKEIAVTHRFSSPNLAAIKLLPKNMHSNLLMNPDKNTLKRGQFQQDLGEKANSLYIKYWQLLKIGG